jgi:hypothetical protein
LETPFLKSQKSVQERLSSDSCGAIPGIGDGQVTGSPAYCRAVVLRELRVRRRKRFQADSGLLEVHLGTYQQAVVDFMFGAKHALASGCTKKDGR